MPKKLKSLTITESYIGPGGIISVVVFQSDYSGSMRDLIEYLNGYQDLNFQRLSPEDDGTMHG